LQLFSRTYERATFKAEPYHTNGLSNDKNTEWILHFHGENQELYDTYFTIGSAWGATIHSKEQFLTLIRAGDKAKIMLLPKMDIDVTTDTSQRWYMQYTRPHRGDTEVKIYSKFKNTQTKYFLTISYADYLDYRGEYHIYTVSGGGSMPNYQKSSLEAQTYDYQHRPLQVFRLLECDYKLDDGTEKRKIIRKAPAAGDYALLKGLFINAFRDSHGNFWLQPSGTVQDKGKIYYTQPTALHAVLAGQIFKKLFGLSGGRFYQLRKQAENRIGNTAFRVAEIMSKSTSIFDYAGKMRIKPTQFRTMFKTWKSFNDQNKKDVLCYKKGCIKGYNSLFHYIINKRDKMKFLEI